jgi:hypothetical protein
MVSPCSECGRIGKASLKLIDEIKLVADSSSKCIESFDEAIYSGRERVRLAGERERDERETKLTR